MADPVTRNLQWTRWYRPGATPWNNGGAMPDMQNAEPLPDNSGFRTFRGARRLTGATPTAGTYNGSTAAGIYAFDPVLYNVAKGTGLMAVVSDGSSNEVCVAHTIHKSETGRDTTSTAGQQALRRVKANQFPVFQSLHGNTYLYDAENPVYAYDGERNRLAGIRPPRTRPYLTSSSSNTDLLYGFESGASSEATVTSGAHQSADAKEGTNAWKVTWSTASDSVNLCTDGISATLTSTQSAAGMWVKADKYVPAGELKVNISVSPSLAYVTIDQEIQPDVWTWIEWAHGQATNAVDTFNISIVNTDWNPTPITFWFDGLYALDVTAGDHADNYQVCYSFYDSVRDRESNPSPPSTVFVPPSSCRLVVNRNTEGVEDSTNVDKIRVYLKNLNRVYNIPGLPDGPTDDLRWFLVQEAAIADTYTINLGDEETIEFIQGLKPRWPGEPPVPGASAVVHGDRIVSAVRMDDYSTGTVTAVVGSDTLTGSGTSWQRFMEGMQIRLTSSGGTVDQYTYAVVRVISTTSMKISRTFTAFGVSASQDGVGYEGGATGGSASYVISAPNDVIRYSAKYVDPNSKLVESDSEAFSDVQISVRPNDGDKIVGLGIANRDLLVFKSNSVFLLTQNFGEPDGFGPVFNDPEIVSMSIGCRARRSIVQDRTGGLTWFASNKSIVRYSGGAIQTLVDNEQMSELLADAGNVGSAESTFGDSFGAYDPESDCYYLFIYPGTNDEQTNPTNSTLYLGMRVAVYDFRHQHFRKIVCSGIHPRSAELLADDNGRSSIIVGDDQGKLWRWGKDEDFNAWGLQSHSVKGVAASSSNNTVVTSSFSNIDDDVLIGLYVTKISASDPESYETRRISDNATSSGDLTITVGTNWTANPATGDTILVGAIESYVDFMEHYAPGGMAPAVVRLDLNHGAWADDLLSMRAFTALSSSPSQRFASTADEAAIVYLNAAELQQTGPITFPGGLWGRPWRYRLHWWAVADLDVYNIEMTEMVEGETTP